MLAERFSSDSSDDLSINKMDVVVVVVVVVVVMPKINDVSWM